MPTSDELKAGLAIVRAVADTIRETGRAPRGVLYAALMGKGITLSSYETIERVLINGNLVRRDGEELVWIA